MNARLEDAIAELIEAAEALGVEQLRGRRTLDAHIDPVLALVAIARRDRREDERTAAVRAAHLSTRARIGR